MRRMKKLLSPNAPLNGRQHRVQSREREGSLETRHKRGISRRGPYDTATSSIYFRERMP